MYPHKLLYYDFFILFLQQSAIFLIFHTNVDKALFLLSFPSVNSLWKIFLDNKDVSSELS